jgi:hypothetical protein
VSTLSIGAVEAVDNASMAFEAYKAAKLTLPSGEKYGKYDGDLGQLPIDLDNLNTGIQSNGDPSDEWNQLVEYAKRAGDVAKYVASRCPAK